MRRCVIYEQRCHHAFAKCSGIKPYDCHVLVRVRRNQPRRNLALIVKLHRQIAGGIHHVVVGHHQPTRIHQESRAAAEFRMTATTEFLSLSKSAVNCWSPPAEEDLVPSGDAALAAKSSILALSLVRSMRCSAPAI